MANLFHIPTTDHLAAQNADASMRVTFAGVNPVKETIAPAGRRAR